MPASHALGRRSGLDACSAAASTGLRWAAACAPAGRGEPSGELRAAAVRRRLGALAAAERFSEDARSQEGLRGARLNRAARPVGAAGLVRRRPRSGPSAACMAPTWVSARSRRSATWRVAAAASAICCARVVALVGELGLVVEGGDLALRPARSDGRVAAGHAGEDDRELAAATASRSEQAERLGGRRDRQREAGLLLPRPPTG